MARFMLLYVGPPAPPDASHEGWPEWFAGVGDRLVDRGAPLAEGRAVHGDGSIGEPVTHLNGYSIVEAEDLAGVQRLVRDHPYLSAGEAHSIGVYALP